MNKRRIVEQETVIPDSFQEFDSLVALGRYRAVHQKSKIVYFMLKYGAELDDQITYEQLDLRARTLASKLQSLGVSGRHALLLFPSGLEFVIAFMGCLYAGVAAVPTPLPGRKDKDWIKTAAIARDADVAVVLTIAEHGKFIRESLDEDAFLRGLSCVETDTVSDELAAQWFDPGITRDDIAFLQYTSGSTGMPKGVVVTHGNLLHNEEMMRKAYQHTEDTVCVSWLPLFHDMGLIGNVLHTLYLGGQCYLMTPVAFLQQPLRWLQAVSDYKASTCFAPNFAYELCLRRITEEQRDKLDLSHWSLALNGAEPVRANTLERFAEFFAPSGFKWSAHYPAYGLAEATLFVSGTGRYEEPYIVCVDSQELQNHRVIYSDAQEGTQRLVSSGLTNTVQQTVIVNPDNFKRCASNEVGEIWIKGGSVAKGYWRKPEQTEETFNARIADDGDGPYLRTGDLGFIDQGRLFITGRLKDMVIVNGANFYPQDIELAVQENHNALRLGYGAVFGIELDSNEQIVVVQEVERTQIKKLDAHEVFATIRQTVAQEFQISVAAIVLIKPMMLPQTSSGKVQRRETRKRFYEYDLAEVASWYVSDNLRSEVEGGAKVVVAVPQQSAAPDSEAKANAMIHWLRSYSETRINSALIDERRSVPPYIVMDFGSHGLLGMGVPEKYAGRALTVGDSLRVIEQLAAIDANLAAMVAVHHVLGTRPIMNYGSQALKDRFLSQIAEGRILSALAITEPGAGSNPHAILATACPATEGGWLINGEKCWIGNGAWAGVINTFVQVVDAAGNPKGMTAFAIEQGRAGMRIGEEAATMGMRGMVQNRVYYKNVHVTEDDMLGRVGQGMEVAQDAMMHGRLAIAAMSLGGLKRAAQLMTRYAQRREVATGKLVENPVTIQRLAELHAAIAAVQAMVRIMGECIDNRIEIPVEVYAVCKTSAPEFLWQGVDQLMQMLGGRGYTENNAVPQMMRDLRLFRIFEGPTEALNQFLGSRVVNDSKGFMSFVETTLQSPNEVRAMVAMSGEILRLADDSGQRLGLGVGQINQWAQSFIGELTTLHVVKAFVCRQANVAPSMPLQQAQEWLCRRIEIKAAEVKAAFGVQPVWNSPLQLINAANALVFDIGDVQQHAAGMERELDVMLARDYAEGDTLLAPFEEKPAIHGEVEEAVVALSTNAANAQEEVELWMLDWLSKQRRIGNDEIDARTTFVDIGLDSVSAVELSFALQTWLDFEVDSTVVWQYPSIGVLSRFLAQEKDARMPAAPAAAASNQVSTTDDLSALSDDDLEKALAGEMD
ncbi:MAG: AMP-binding protein [Aquabacterium sp.]|nr:AMP-binding protein [Aquabacterium sp.]